MDVNKEQAVRFMDRLRVAMGGDFEGKTVGILGLAFKPNTDDMRDAKSRGDHRRHCWPRARRCKAYDPIAMENTKRIFPQICYANNAYEVAEDADALVIVTEWNEFKLLNMERIKIGDEDAARSSMAATSTTRSSCAGWASSTTASAARRRCLK